MAFNAVESIASLFAMYADDTDNSDPKYNDHQHDDHRYVASHPPVEHRFFSVLRQTQTLTHHTIACLVRCDAPPLRPPLHD
jgi:hypothetical protein